MLNIITVAMSVTWQSASDFFASHSSLLAGSPVFRSAPLLGISRIPLSAHSARSVSGYHSSW